MKAKLGYFLGLFLLGWVGCSTPVDQREYVLGYVVKTAGGIETFREAGFVESKEPAEGYLDSTAVRAVVRINYNSDGTVSSLDNLRVSDTTYQSAVREFIFTLRAERGAVNDLNGREHDFRVWIYEGKVVHIESSR